MPWEIFSSLTLWCVIFMSLGIYTLSLGIVKGETHLYDPWARMYFIISVVCIVGARILAVVS